MVKLVQSRKTSEARFDRLAGRVTLVRLWHSPKASLPLPRMPSSSVTLVRLHAVKAWLPMLVTLPGIVMI